jgi:protein-tyrosine kinase
MERISEALQRARQERNSERPGFGGSSKRGSVAAEDTQVAANKIVYTQTRSFDVSRGTLAEQRIVSGFDPCMFTDAFKVLSTQVSHKLRENNWKTLGVTSPNEHEGKTVVAINLAISLAMEFHQTALLVDADMRRPKVRDAFGLPPGPGLCDYLVSQTPLEELLIHPGIKGLVVLPGGAPLANSSELLGSRRMADLVEELKNRYRSRIVLFDLPPLLTGADVLAFAPQFEAALLVVEEGRTRREDVARAAELLRETHLIGTVLNKSAEKNMAADKPYGYGYGYGSTV